MFRILRAISVYSSELGYVQGFNFIVGSMIRFLKKEETIFWMFFSLLENQKLIDIYLENMPGLKLLNF